MALRAEIAAEEELCSEHLYDMFAPAIQHGVISDDLLERVQEELGRWQLNNVIHPLIDRFECRHIELDLSATRTGLTNPPRFVVKAVLPVEFGLRLEGWEDDPLEL